MAKTTALFFFTICLLAFTSRTTRAEEASDVDAAGEDADNNDTADPVNQEKLEYARGSVCNYCSYCKFCKLCDADCPCETSEKKPNCRMCKYCKFCYLCSAFCDTVCTAGGILDRVTGAIVNSLPSVNHNEVDGDIESVKTWIDKKKDEL